MAGVCALRTWGRHNVTVATGPSRSRRTPASSNGSESLTGLSGCLLAATGTAALAELNARFRQNSVHEPIRTTSRRGKSPDALTRGIAFDQVLRERGPFGSDDPAAFLCRGGCSAGCHLEIPHVLQWAVGG